MTPLDARRAHDIGDVADMLFARPTPAMLLLERAADELERQRETYLPPRDSGAAKNRPETDK